MNNQTLHLNNNTKFKEFIEIPARGLKWLLDKIKLKKIFKRNVEDPRQSSSDYPIESLLMAGVQIPLFRQPSRHKFYQHLSKPFIHRNNLSHIIGVQGSLFPSSRTLEDNYQILNPQNMQEVLFSLFKGQVKSKLFTNHTALLSEKMISIAIDGFVIH